MSTNVLYGETERRVYPLSVIYDPDVDLPSSLESEAKIIPAVSSLVVDDTSGLHNTVYVVVAVDNETLKSTLRPAAFAEINDQTVDRILSYGNNIYMLYYSPVTITDDTETEVKCTRLSIDDKFTLFGNHSANYQLIRTNSDGTKTIISQTVVDAIKVSNAGASLANGVFKRVNNDATGSDRIWSRANNNIRIKYNSDTNKWELKNLTSNDVYYTADYDETKEPWELEWTATSSTYGTVPSMINVVSPNGVYGSIAETVVGSGIRKCIGCYSYADFEDGEAITINVFDAAGILLASAQLITKRALILHDLSDDSNPIVKFEITANQMIDGEPFLYRNQSVDELAIYPKITYANGEQEIVSVGDGNGYCYGKDEINTKYVGVSYPITVKYYIPIETQTTISQNVNNQRYLVATANVRIVNATENTFSKISVIPVFNPTDEVWELHLNGYKKSRTGREILTNKASVVGFVGSSSKFGVRQDITIQATQILASGSVESYNQTAYIEVRPPYKYVTTIINSSHVGRYILVDDTDLLLTADNIDTYINSTQSLKAYQSPFVIDSTTDPDSIPYGSDELPHIAPYLEYNEEEEAYCIPADVFSAMGGEPGQQMSAVEVFLENFYYTAKPPCSDTESSAADNPPTHFAIRLPNVEAPLVSEIPVANFSNLVTFPGYPGNQMSGNTVVIEFWRKIEGTDNYEVLYGVPVYVK